MGVVTRFYAACWVIVALIVATLVTVIAFRTMAATDQRMQRCLDAGGTWVSNGTCVVR